VSKVIWVLLEIYRALQRQKNLQIHQVIAMVRVALSILTRGVCVSVLFVTKMLDY